MSVKLSWWKCGQKVCIDDYDETPTQPRLIYRIPIDENGKWKHVRTWGARVGSKGASCVTLVIATHLGTGH
jgi:hypothetical protein